MRKMPRLITDDRWRKIRRRPIHIALLCAIVCGAWSALKSVSEGYREEGEKLLKEMGQERDCLSVGAVDKVASICKKIGSAVSSAKESLAEKWFVYDGDPRELVLTRVDERQEEAKGCVTEYRTSVDRRDKLLAKLNELKLKIDVGGLTRTNIDKQLDEILASDASRFPEGAESIKKAMSDFQKVLESPIVLPGVYQKAREEARVSLERARRTASGMEWLQTLNAIETEADTIYGSILDSVNEIRECDKRARVAIDNLLNIPFDGRRLMLDCKAKLDEAVQTAGNMKDRSVKAFHTATNSFWSSVAEVSNRIERVVAVAEDTFVDEKELNKIRGTRDGFAVAVGSAKDTLLTVDRDFREAVSLRDNLFVKAGGLQSEFGSVLPKNEADVEDLCERASGLAVELESLRFDNELLAATNRIAATFASLESLACALLRDLMDKLTDWNDYYAKEVCPKLRQARSRTKNCVSKLAEIEKKLSNASGAASGDLRIRESELSAEAGLLLASIPESLACNNGKEVADADKAVKELAERVEALECGIASFDEEYRKAVVDGVITEIVYDFEQQEWAYYMGLGRDTFEFALELPFGRHNIEIAASKSTGQLFPKNKMARGIELKGELADSSGNKAFGRLFFGNTVAEAERQLLSFNVDGSAGRRDFVLKLTLVHKHNALSGTTMSDWDTGKLRLVLKVDGGERSSILIRRSAAPQNNLPTTCEGVQSVKPVDLRNDF